MKNNDYTCDRCGKQFNQGEGYTLILSKMAIVRNIAGIKPAKKHGPKLFRYDFCEDCASHVATRIEDVLQAERRETDEEEA